MSSSPCRSTAAVIFRRGAAALLLSLFALGAAAPGDSLPTRRERLESMTPEQKEELQRKQERFENLDKEQQDRLRHFHDELVGDPDCDRLRGIMRRYDSWLMSLPPGERADLLERPPQQRIARIREILNEQEEENFKRLLDEKEELPSGDREVILAWLGEFVTEHEAEILATVPEKYRDDVLHKDEEQKRKSLIWSVLNTRFQHPDRPRPGADDYKQLTARLSQETRQKLLTIAPEKKEDVLREWVRATFFSRMWFNVSDETLQEFFLNELTPKEREQLEKLPRDMMLRELRRMHFERRFHRGGRGSRGGSDGESEGRHDGPPPGGGRSGPPGEGPPRPRPDGSRPESSRQDRSGRSGPAVNDDDAPPRD